MIAVVPSQSAWVVERLGRYHRTLAAGTHFLVPLIDRVAFRFVLHPVDLELTDNAITHDNVPVSVASVVRWQIADAQTAAYASADAKEFVRELVRHAQRNWIAAQSSKDIRERTRELQGAVLRGTADAAAKAGVKLVDHDVKRIESV